MQRMRGRRRLARGKGRRVRVMTGGADLSVHLVEFPRFPAPVTAGAAMDAGLPIAVGGAMATAAEGRTFGDLQMAPIARLQRLQIVFVMTIKAIVVAMMPAM